MRFPATVNVIGELFQLGFMKHLSLFDFLRFGLDT